MYDPQVESCFEVQQILNEKIFQGKLFYLVKWKGYPHSQNSWQPIEHLQNAVDHIEMWKQKKRKLTRLDNVNKRKKNSESFDGEKFIAKGKKSKQIIVEKQKPQQKLRKSQRLISKDDNIVNRIQRQFSKDDDNLSCNSQTTSYRGKSLKNRQKDNNSLQSILFQIAKLKDKDSTKNAKKLPEKTDKNIKPSQNNQKVKKGPGRPKKQNKTFQPKEINILNKLNTSKVNKIQIKKKQKLTINQKLGSQGMETSQKSENLFQKLHQISLNKKKSKSSSKVNNISKQNVNIEKEKNSKQTKKSSSITKIYEQTITPKLYTRYKKDRMEKVLDLNLKKKNQKNIIQNLDFPSISNENKQPPSITQKSFRNNHSLILSSQNLFFGKNDHQDFDQLDQLGLTPSKRLPNFGSYIKNNQMKVSQAKQSVKFLHKNRRNDLSNKAISPIIIDIDHQIQDCQRSVIVIEGDNQFHDFYHTPTKIRFLNDDSYQRQIVVQNKKSQTHKICLEQSQDPRVTFKLNLAFKNLQNFLLLHPSKTWQKDVKNAIGVRTSKEGKKGDDLIEEQNKTDDEDWQFPFDGNKLRNEIIKEKTHDSFNIQKSQSEKISQMKTHSRQSYSEPFTQSHYHMTESQTSEDMDLLAGLQQDIEEIFEERYPTEQLNKSIKDEINHIVKKIAYENMDLEVGLNLIDKWMDGYQKEKNKKMEIQRKEKDQKKDVYQKRNLFNQNIIKEPQISTQESGEIILEQKSDLEQKNPERNIINNNVSSNQNKKMTPVPQPTHAVSPEQKNSKTVQEQNIIKIVQQFYYKGQRCFKILLKNNTIVNTYYLQVKKNCPKILFDFYQRKCQILQQQNEKISKALINKKAVM